MHRRGPHPEDREEAGEERGERAVPASQRSPAAEVLALQGSVGNQAVARLLAGDEGAMTTRTRMDRPPVPQVAVPAGGQSEEAPAEAPDATKKALWNTTVIKPTRQAEAEVAAATEMPDKGLLTMLGKARGHAADAHDTINEMIDSESGETRALMVFIIESQAAILDQLEQWTHPERANMTRARNRAKIAASSAKRYRDRLTVTGDSDVSERPSLKDPAAGVKAAFDKAVVKPLAAANRQLHRPDGKEPDKAKSARAELTGVKIVLEETANSYRPTDPVKFIQGLTIWEQVHAVEIALDDLAGDSPMPALPDIRKALADNADNMGRVFP